MAISLGAAALAFAGGAATQYNKTVDEERKAAAKRQERLQELMDNAAVKQEESKYSQEFDKYQKELALESTLKAVPGGASGNMGQLAIAEHLGFDRTSFLRSKDFGYLEWNGVGKPPIPYTQRLMENLGSDFDPKRIKYAERVRANQEGKTFTKDGAGILRGVPTAEDGSFNKLDVARGLGFGENDPAWLVGIPPEDPEERKKWNEDSRRVMLGEKPEYEYKTVNDRVIRVDKAGKEEAKVVYEPEGGSEFDPNSPEGKQIGDLLQLQEMVAADERYQPLLTQYEDLLAAGKRDLQILTGETTVDGVTYTRAKLVEKTPNGLEEIGTAVNLGREEDLPKDPNARAAQNINQLYQRT
jgi:hypothetical protein